MSDMRDVARVAAIVIPWLVGAWDIASSLLPPLFTAIFG